MKKYSIFSVLFAGIAIAYTACKHEIPAFPDADTSTPSVITISCSTDSVYFANTIQPLLVSGCAMSGCHDAITHKEGINLTTYTGVMKEVNAGNASNSSLYKSMVRTDDERMPPSPAAAFTADQLTKVRSWINQGAKNNGCNSCDTTSFKFTATIKPLIQTKCQGCHNPASLGGGIDLSTYAGIKSSAASGKLYGSVIWANGFFKMPQNSKLPACEITQIKKWIAAGSLNN
ncbi:MAG: c-type cytochrome domain-containing protein [Bacteroidota bacterium]|nr:c-type cytochrome domain-containing protein [Bacteroidota bacterium]